MQNESLLEKISSYTRLRRVTAWIFRFIKNCRRTGWEKKCSTRLVLMNWIERTIIGSPKDRANDYWIPQATTGPFLRSSQRGRRTIESRHDIGILHWQENSMVIHSWTRSSIWRTSGSAREEFQNSPPKRGWRNLTNFRRIHDHTGANRCVSKFANIDTPTGGLRRAGYRDAWTFLDW